MLKNSAKSDLAKAGRQFAYYQVMISSLFVVVLALTSYFIWELSVALSVIYGGAIAVIPNFVFAHKAFKYGGATASKKVIESFYSGEKLKMVLTAVLFAMTFRFLTFEPIPLFSTFCLVMVMPLLLPIFLRKLIEK